MGGNGWRNNVSIVGEHLVVPVSNDSKFPHASFKCNMCDCYFNDEFATKAHIKGRRHRLNYKKTYDSTIYVEPTKSMVSYGQSFTGGDHVPVHVEKRIGA